MKEKTCCFSGHRIIPTEMDEVVRSRLRDVLTTAIDNGYRFFGTGGALGFDTLAAQTVIELREKYPYIKLILVLPCKSQTKGWKLVDIEIYERIKSLADKVVYTSDKYYKGCMQKRNRHLVDYSSLCICYLTEKTGGTAYTVNYAKTMGLSVVNIAKKEEHQKVFL